MNQNRSITAHAIDGELGDMNIKVVAQGPFGPGGAQTEYAIGEAVRPPQGIVAWFGGQPPPGIKRWLANIRFQSGDPAEGVNGVTLEAVLAVCHDRLECFQEGPHANAYNAEALAHIEKALEALKNRTRERDVIAMAIDSSVKNEVEQFLAGSSKPAYVAADEFGLDEGIVNQIMVDAGHELCAYCDWWCEDAEIDVVDDEYVCIDCQ